MKKLMILLVSVLMVLGLATAANAKTYFGTSIPGGVQYADSHYGKLDVIRLYYSGPPKPWGSKDGTAGRPLVVSFKLDTKKVNSGKYDGLLKNWFRTAPTGVPIWYSYNHEPENNYTTKSEKKSYRNAWRHIVSIERSFHRNNLKSTFIGMSWRIRAGKPGFRSYYPGDKYIDVLAWDGYNDLCRGTKPYDSPKNIYGPAIKINRKHNKPFGIAEWGTGIYRGDAQGRGDWIGSVGRYLKRNNAQFGTYWDNSGCKLNDAPSKLALTNLMR